MKIKIQFPRSSTNEPDQGKLTSKGTIQAIVVAVFVALALLAASFRPIASLVEDYFAKSALGDVYQAHKTASQNARNVNYGCSTYGTSSIASRLNDNFYYDESTETVFIDINDMEATTGCSTMPTSGTGSGASSVSKPYVKFVNVNNTVCSDIVSDYVNDSRALTVVTDSDTVAIKHSGETVAGNFDELGGKSCNSKDDVNTITIWEK